MYKPPIELVMEEVLKKMDENFENSVFKAIQKVGINVDKEELLKALIYDRGQYDKGYEDAMNEVKHPQPLKFEELHENMWVYDRTYKLCRQVHKFYSNGSRDVIQFKSDHYPKLAEAYFFEEDRYYPITIIGDEE